MFTTGIVSTREGRRIALCSSADASMLEKESEGIAAPACRESARADPDVRRGSHGICLPGWRRFLPTVWLYGRRQFVDVADRFSRGVPARAGVALCDLPQRRDRPGTESFPRTPRLLFHQTESGPTMEALHAWLARQFDERRVEPNSALGGAISYLLKHWEKLTLFLRVAGAPLDNNICERALKKAILHRKNALFYKTCHKALHVGDVFMSLIYTCTSLCGANPFDYLTELERHAGELSTNPQNWMPWNYRETLEGMGDVQTPSPKKDDKTTDMAQKNRKALAKRTERRVA